MFSRISSFLYRARAFTLVETLLALMVSMILLLACVALLSSHSANWQHWQNFQAWRYQNVVLARLFRNSVAATHIGSLCVPQNQLKIEDHFQHLSEHPIARLPSSTVPSRWRQRLVENSDVLFIENWQALGMGRILLDQASVLEVDNKTAVAVGEHWLITDCEKASGVIITAVKKKYKKKYVTTNAKISFSAGNSVQVYRYQRDIFFVANTKRTSTKKHAISALYHWTPTSQIEEIAENIGGIALKKIAPALFQLEIVMVSPYPIFATHQTYTFRGEQQEARDYHAYHVMKLVLY